MEVNHIRITSLNEILMIAFFEIIIVRRTPDFNSESVGMKCDLINVSQIKDLRGVDSHVYEHFYASDGYIDIFYGHLSSPYFPLFLFSFFYFKASTHILQKIHESLTSFQKWRFLIQYCVATPHVNKCVFWFMFHLKEIDLKMVNVFTESWTCFSISVRFFLTFSSFRHEAAIWNEVNFSPLYSHNLLYSGDSIKIFWNISNKNQLKLH